MAKDHNDFGVYIGRFQPFHTGHEKVARHVLNTCKKIVFVIGSASTPRTIRNPFTYEERCNFILKALEDVKDRVLFVAADDYFYSDVIWSTAIVNAVNIVTNYSTSISFAKPFKDATSYYLNIFNDWRTIPVNISKLNATDIRNAWLEGTDFKSSVPACVYEYMATFNKVDERGEVFKYLKDEYSYIKKYKESWKSCPYPPAFVTADAVVIKGGMILLIKRRHAPGAGLYALPGGFVNPDETFINAAARELKEETTLRVFTDSVKDSKVFDHPGRSLRGRVITNAFFWDLGMTGEIPVVKNEDDAAEAVWVPIIRVRQDKMFEDHFSIINYFLSRK
jgi:bifunctional NMN adenylyltransferase/nudix hydrolase